MWVLCLPLFGYGYGHWEQSLTLRQGPAMVAVLAAWAALHAGAMWWNAALDRDEGEVLLGRALPVPQGIERAALMALGLAVLLGALAGPVVGAAVAGCSALAVLYSHPATAWKAHPALGPAVNLLGYGVLSPFAGWSLVGAPATPRAAATLAVVAAVITGCFFAAQAFQADEDRRRGYRTLVATHGPRAALAAARGALGAGLLGLLALCGVGWYPRACLVALPAIVALDRHLAAWGARGDGGSEADARKMVDRLVLVAMLVLAGAYAEYLGALLAGVPGAGLGTVGGHP